MPAYTYNLFRAVEPFNGTLYEIIKLSVTVTGGQFEHRSGGYDAVVYDNTQFVRSFCTVVLNGQKEYIAYFTSDAFAAFTGPVTIELRDDGVAFQSFTGINIATAVTAMDAIAASFSAPQGNNLWLASL